MQATADTLGEVHFFREPETENMVRAGVYRLKRKVYIRYMPKQNGRDMNQRNCIQWRPSSKTAPNATMWPETGGRSCLLARHCPAY